MATTRGTDIHYESHGEGPPIVFVHGLGATSNVWHAQRIAFGKAYRVIVYDRSGSGRSPPSAAGYSIDGFADELAGLLDTLAVPTAVVVGHSLGSMVSQRFASKYASRTKALILAGGEAEIDVEGKRILTERAAAVEAGGMVLVADAWLSGVLCPATREGNPALAGMVREMFMANDPQTYALHCRALRDGSVVADHPSIACPALLTVGDQDGVTPIAWQRRIAAGIPGSCIRVIPNTGHMTMQEAPDFFNSAVHEFLASIEL